MYIISKFQDYYDSVVGVTGIDKKTVFNRSQELYKINDLKSDLNYSRYSRYSHMNTIGYWDKHKPSCRVMAISCGLYIVDKVYMGHCFFADDLPEEITKRFNNRKVTIDEPEQFKKNNGVSCEHGYLLFNPIEINDFLTRLNYSETQIKKFIKLPQPINRAAFKEVGSPVFMTANYLLNNSFFKCVSSDIRQHYIHESNNNCESFIVTNPILSQFGIPAMIDAFQLFQEISMYIADVTNVEVESHMTDIEKRNAKGFDNKSFKHRK